MYQIKKAQVEHQKPIKALIRATRLNPLGIDFRRFVVATEAAGAVIGCGQVKPHGDGSRELASIAVVPEWRRQGVAQAIIARLRSGHPGPLWLTCASPMVTFYEPLGFGEIFAPNEMPVYFRRVFRLSRIWTRLTRRRFYLAVMVEADDGRMVHRKS